jgi:hypothetical protein
MGWGFTDWLAGIASGGARSQEEVNFTPVEELVAETPPATASQLPEGLSNPNGADPTKAYNLSSAGYTSPNGAPVGGFWSPDNKQTPSAYLGTPYETGYYDYERQAGSRADDRNFMYGRSPNAANTAVDKAYQTGADARAYGQSASDIGYDMARQYGSRRAQQGDWAQQNGALGLSSGYGTSLAELEAQQGQSAAQAQLQQGTNQGMASQVALARSGRGLGGGEAAAGLAQGNMAGIAANQANQSAMLRSQEEAAWRQRQAGNLANAAGIQQGIGQQYGQQVGTDLNAYFQNQGQNDAAAQASITQGNQVYMEGIGADISTQGIAHGVRAQEMTGGLTREDNFLRQYAAKQGWDLAQQQRQDQQDAALYQGLASGGATLFDQLGRRDEKSSDIRAKKDIVRSDAPALDFARAGSMVSPKAPDLEALDAVAASPGYGYTYEDPGAPGAAPGRQYGPMAQELASTPAGATAVTKGKDGKLAIDTGRLQLLDHSAISAQQRELDLLKQQIAAFSSQPGAVYPRPSQGSF